MIIITYLAYDLYILISKLDCEVIFPQNSKGIIKYKYNTSGCYAGSYSNEIKINFLNCFFPGLHEMSNKQLLTLLSK